ncbi:uncharacterized protein A1O9_02664 [Exophiala aquamarina CBS 119918]|uniref:Cytochrome P450 oxidoreductase n=1 Tax=Exophiala aquamarina CBS 119918 TaxID=1182545 RepID=A0A072PLW8_9EURO|nr:uncharacterized protein A1O9_02664 [Exophiala aquamarina CBS 119918]KEF61099.1 hypothetical protein A1O9_02664 [Exophiala aquamarina CBS 119918]
MDNALSRIALASPPTLLEIFLYVIVASFLLVTIYRLTLHPLAKYPGPLRYKISGWPLVYQCYKGNRHLYSLRDHEKYGPIVRTSPNSLSFSSPKALHQIYGSRAINVRKSKFYETLDAGPGGATTHTEIDKERHAARRRILNHAFSEAAIRETETFVIDNVGKFIKLIGPNDSENDEGWSTPRNMSDWLNWMAYDIMGNLVFGKSYNCLGSEEHREMPRLMTEGTKFGYWFAYLPCAPVLQPLAKTSFMQWIGGDTVRDNAVLGEYAISQFEERAALEKRRLEGKEKPPTHKDLMHYLLNNFDPKTGMRPTTDELKGDTLSLIGAGADTIATTLSAAFFYLARNESVLRRLLSEIRNTFGCLDEIHSSPKMDSCVYLNACIEETLRLAPAVASQLPREVMRGGIVIDGEYVPEGIVVGVPSYVVHHTREAFPQSWSFQPERWIAGSELADHSTVVSKEDIARAREAMCPFSLGSRGCIGKTFAYMEMRIALASVLWSYDFKEVGGRERKGGGGRDLEIGRERQDEFQIFDCFGADRDGPVLRFRKRE